ncbi:hypothetical protein PBI_GRAYSON_242 [Rhodococcus phage Grayson]|nr:hypothetical protein PBI_GRAYSON_242 [Rhodococcus phage Grayson]
MPVNYKALWNKLIGKSSNKHDLPEDGMLATILLIELDNDWKWTVKDSYSQARTVGFEKTLNEALERGIFYVRDRTRHKVPYTLDIVYKDLGHMIE